MTTTVSPEGEIRLPDDLRRQDDIVPGQRFDLERLEAGRYTLSRHAELDAGVERGGILDWLLACPEKDWFQALPAESTESL